MIGAHPVSVVSLVVICYHCNCLDGQLNFQAFTHWLIGSAISIYCAIGNLWHGTQAHFGAVMSGSLQLPCTSSNKTEVEKEVSHFSLRGDPMEVRKFCLNDVRGPVCTIQKVTNPPFSTVSVHTNSSVKGHCMWVHVLTEPMPGPHLPTAVVPMVTYRELHLGSSRVPICLCILSTHTMQIPTKALVGQAAPANQVPPCPPNWDF